VQWRSVQIGDEGGRGRVAGKGNECCDGPTIPSTPPLSRYCEKARRVHTHKTDNFWPWAHPPSPLSGWRAFARLASSTAFHTILGRRPASRASDNWTRGNGSDRIFAPHFPVLPPHNPPPPPPPPRPCAAVSRESFQSVLPQPSPQHTLPPAETAIVTAKMACETIRKKAAQHWLRFRLSKSCIFSSIHFENICFFCNFKMARTSYSPRPSSAKPSHFARFASARTKGASGSRAEWMSHTQRAGEPSLPYPQKSQKSHRANLAPSSREIKSRH
jgi:hypothetical protein